LISPLRHPLQARPRSALAFYNVGKKRNREIVENLENAPMVRTTSCPLLGLDCCPEFAPRTPAAYVGRPSGDEPHAPAHELHIAERRDPTLPLPSLSFGAWRLPPARQPVRACFPAAASRPFALVSTHQAYHAHPPPPRSPLFILTLGPRRPPPCRR
jgi:hypothetical protein